MNDDEISASVIVSDFLLAHRPLMMQRAVSGQYKAVIHESRNRIVMIHEGNSPSLVIKMPRGDDTRRTFLNEIAFYTFASRQEDFTLLRAWIPEFISFHQDEGLLILQVAGTPFSCPKLDETGLRVLEKWLGHAGQGLRVIRRESEASSLKGSRALKPLSPWLLTLPPTRRLGMTGASGLEGLEGLHLSGPIMDSIGRARDNWKTSAVVHGDLKLQNCVMSTSSPERLRFVDWEFAGLGDPLWDAASMVQSVWTTALMRSSTEAYVRPATELASLCSSILRSFWRAYYENDPSFCTAETAAELSRIQDYVCCRLVVVAYELSESPSSYLVSRILELAEAVVGEDSEPFDPFGR